MKIETWRTQERRVVQEKWTLEGRRRCAVTGCLRLGSEVHHPFGRTPEPWASSRLVCVLLCHEHHEEITGTPGAGMNVLMRDHFRDLAVDRMMGYIVGELSEVMLTEPVSVTVSWHIDSEEAATLRFKHVMDVANKNGIAPPGYESNRRKP